MLASRWKLMGVGLALGLGAVVAVADVPSRTGVSCNGKANPQSVPQSSPKPEYTPAPAVAVADPPLIPIPTSEVQTPLAPTVPAVPVEFLTPADLPLRPFTFLETAPMPRSVAVVVRNLPLEPTPPAPTSNVPQTSPLIAELPTPTPGPIPTPAPTPLLPPVPPSPPVTETQPPTPIPQQQVLEKKLKVLLHLSEDRPRFQVMDGEETYLRVISDGVNVKSPSDNGSPMPQMKATGRVLFVTPGGEGTCDELTVSPGTGQVIVTGKVNFKYNWGKVETTVSGDRMTFRLGSPSPMPPTAVPASFSIPR